MTVLDDAGQDAQSAYLQGMDLANQKKREESLQILTGVIEGRYGAPAGELVRLSYRRVLRTLADLGRWDEVLTLSAAAIERFDHDADLHRLRGEALYFLGQIDGARTHLERAVALVPHRAESRAALLLLKQEVDAGASAAAEPAVSRPVRGWPTRTSMFEDPRHLVGKYMLRGLPKDRFIGEGTAFFTLGSCFAGNLAERLKERGFPVHYEDIGEEVNSTFANKSLLDWIEQGVIDEPTAMMDALYGSRVQKRFRKGLRHCHVFVMTLGVAAGFFHEDTGAFAFAPLTTRLGGEALFKRYRMRTTTVAENVANITAIIAAVRRFAKHRPKVVLTVSPVPMAATTEHNSAITADALSKSTLRVACEEVVNAHADDGVIYWPSFEMVRWLGAHYGPEFPAYGGDDDNSRHVSGWLVDMIIDLFLEQHQDKWPRTES